MLLAAVAGILYLGSGSERPRIEPVVIFTQIPADEGSFTRSDDALLPTYRGSRIVSLDYKTEAAVPQNLTPEFHSAGSPSLSYDNRRIVFSGKKNAGASWQLWLMNRDGSGKRKVGDLPGNALTPAFLPDGNIVFSMEVRDSITGTVYALHTCRPDGSELRRITFHPHWDLYPSVLHDGRIAAVSRQVYPEKKGRVFMVLRPDGTKAQSFYHDRSGAQVKSIIRETTARELVFVKKEETRENLVVLSYADPGKPQRVIASYAAGGVQSVDVLASGQLVASARSSEFSVFALYRMDENGETDRLYMDPAYHAVEPIAVSPKVVPPILPSSVSLDKGAGIVFSQNVQRSQVRLKGDPETEYIRVLGIDRTLQEVSVADDGSFYLKVQSDMPIRFQSLDVRKRVLRGPSAWVWLRNGERRACVGCHAGKAISPDNVVPLAIKQPPVMITDTSLVIDSAYVKAVSNILNEKIAVEF